MLDFDLAELYSVETKQLKRQVKRNIERFPKDFMFELTGKAFENLRSQIGTSSWEVPGICQWLLLSIEYQCYQVFYIVPQRSK